MSKGRLSVFIGGTKAGVLSEGESGRISFEYSRSYDGLPLSMSMPIKTGAYADKIVRPYLLGLLPDDPSVRRDLGGRYGISGENPFELLRHVGLDCPGAVQVCPEFEEDSLLREEVLIPLTAEAIGERLALLAARHENSWVLDGEHWSLGGAQGKIALRRKGGKWYRCEGSAATTHILKPGIVGLTGQALNEYSCMTLAHLVGLPVAETHFAVFAGQPAIVVARFDRSEMEDGSIIRLHQEDLCQAMSVLPSKKYASDGGPSSVRVADLLNSTADSKESVRKFVSYLFFNYLIGGSDAHAKNYSLIYDERGDAHLAPMYDVASIFPYMASKRETRRMAMSIGGENRFGKVGKGSILRFAQAIGLDGDSCIQLMRLLAESVLEKLPIMEEALRSAVGGDALADRMVPRIRQHADLTRVKLL